MTLDKSLKVRAGMSRVRSVFRRAERIERLKQMERWKDGDGVLGLPKVTVPKLALKKKKKEKKAEEAGAAATATAEKKPADKAAAKPAAKAAPKK